MSHAPPRAALDAERTALTWLPPEIRAEHALAVALRHTGDGENTEAAGEADAERAGRMHHALRVLGFTLRPEEPDPQQPMTAGGLAQLAGLVLASLALLGFAAYGAATALLALLVGGGHG
ncbi:hypothetical protein [Paracraurococcus ruber]|nr:hypothetical protein [Paracraurococcus ruber]TDG33988.1 hypothetical protein E2C05_01735 [Paracraurococcus ruber]